MTEEEVTQTESQESAQQEPVEQNQEVSQEEKQLSDKEINFRALREKSEYYERQAMQQAQMMEAMQRQLELVSQNQKSQEAPQEEENPYSDVDDEDWISTQQFKKIMSYELKKAREDTKKELQREIEAREIPNRIRQKCPNFDSVVTQSAIEQLNSEEPEMANAFSKIADEEAKAVAVYRYLSKGSTTVSHNRREAERIIAEEQKRPKTISSAVGNSPISKAIDYEGALTDEMKRSLYEEALRYSRQS